MLKTTTVRGVTHCYDMMPLQLWIDTQDHKIIKLYGKMTDNKIQEIVRLAIKNYIEEVINK